MINQSTQIIKYLVNNKMHIKVITQKTLILKILVSSKVVKNNVKVKSIRYQI